MSASQAPPLSPGLQARLSLMMFLQYAIWGAWLPLFYAFLNEHRGLEPASIGNLISLGAVGALLAPFLAGPLADRYVATEKLLGILHILGAVLVWQLAQLESYGALLAFSVLYSLVYAPTLSLTNSLAFHHLPDRDRDFGKVRVWGTIGWIAVGIGIGQWLYHVHTPADAEAAVVRATQVAGMADAFRASSLLGVVLGIYCFFLPKTPPQREASDFAIGKALSALKGRRLLVLFLVAFPISCVHQFYFVHTAPFLGRVQSEPTFIDTIFGVGGGGLMTIGQVSEMFVLALIPLFAGRISRKTFLVVGLLAYVLRFAIFAYAPEPAFVLPALALHGLCFGCFLFVAFMIVDEETRADARASAQSLFNFVVVGVGVIAGNKLAGEVAQDAKLADGTTDYGVLFSYPMWISLNCLLALLFFYPSRSRAIEPERAASGAGA